MEEHLTRSSHATCGEGGRRSRGSLQKRIYRASIVEPALREGLPRRSSAAPNRLRSATDRTPLRRPLAAAHATPNAAVQIATVTIAIPARTAKTTQRTLSRAAYPARTALNSSPIWGSPTRTMFQYSNFRKSPFPKLFQKMTCCQSMMGLLVAGEYKYRVFPRFFGRFDER